MLMRTPSPSKHMVQLSRIALVVAVTDLASKAAAVRWLSQGTGLSDRWLRFALVHNEQGAFGLSLGAFTWQLNVALTLVAVALVLPVANDLTRVDALAPRALGLIVGGALGNLTSLILSPNGVVDFIAVRYAEASLLVLNVADLAAYVGLAMILRTGYLIVMRLRSELGERPEVDTPARLRLRRVAFADREIDLTITAELAMDRPIAGREMQRPASHRPPRREGEPVDRSARVFDLSRHRDEREGPRAL